MKIAIFTDTFAPQVNGVAKTLERFTAHMAANSIEYCLFTPHDGSNTSFPEQIQAMKSLPLSIYPECRIAIPNFGSMKRKLLEFQPDLIHVATPFNMGLCGLYYAKKLQIPLAGSYHTDFDSYLNYYKLERLSPMLWKYLRWFHSMLQKTFVPSSETLQQLQQKGFHRLHIWGRGVDGTLFHPHYDPSAVRSAYDITAEYLVSYVGRIAPEKDMDTLISIIEKTSEADIHWLLVGDGPLAGELRAQQWRHVTFTGYLQGRKLAAVYAASDAMVFPSPTETFGNVVLEALACGTPVVGADAGGVKTILQHGQTGYLCQPGRAEQFVQSLFLLLADKEAYARMSQAAQAYAATQSWDCIFTDLLTQYEELITRQQEESA